MLNKDVSAEAVVRILAEKVANLSTENAVLQARLMELERQREEKPEKKER